VTSVSSLSASQGGTAHKGSPARKEALVTFPWSLGSHRQRRKSKKRTWKGNKLVMQAAMNLMLRTKIGTYTIEEASSRLPGLKLEAAHACLTLFPCRSWL
jgi:hypothetical protein